MDSELETNKEKETCGRCDMWREGEQLGDEWREGNQETMATCRGREGDERESNICRQQETKGRITEWREGGQETIK